MIDIHSGDCREVLAGLEAGSIDAIVTDPPYELGFMGKKWDAAGVAYDSVTWSECLRVLKPGGHLLAFGGTRTYHRMTCAIEDAGFEIRDSIHWIYGSGFPKSRTALKPAHEPVAVARKPFRGTVAANVLAHGTGALNIDGCRVGASGGGTHCANRDELGKCRGHDNAGRSTSGETFHGPESSGGRWPANIVLTHSPECADEGPCADDCPVVEMDRQSGVSRSQAGIRVCAGRAIGNGVTLHDDFVARCAISGGHNDSGGASRYFPVFRYQAKAPRSERPRVDGMAHPTVKPLALIRWLVRLVTPPGGVVLDPFIGSGTTAEACRLEGFDCIGVESNADYVPLIEARLKAA